MQGWMVQTDATWTDNNLGVLNDVLTGTDRVLNTPLPIAYTIAISQITWVYVVLLPFQLYQTLVWVTIPATIAASYIILGILFIGQEIENPFGNDVNDLPLEAFCDQIEADLDIMAAHAMHLGDNVAEHFESAENRVMHPVSSAPYTSWAQRSEARLRETIKNKPIDTFEARREHESKVKRGPAVKGEANV
jgi:ion channel-forming bestrophin family protein